MPHQRREEPLLRRVRAERKRIPVGDGSWLNTRGFVGAVLSDPAAAEGLPPETVANTTMVTPETYADVMPCG